MIVLDASAAVCLLLDRPLHRAERMRERLQGEALHAPHLIDLEVANALRRLVVAGEIAATRAGAALADLAQFPLTRYPHYPFLSDIWRMRANRTAYDATYVALAEFLQGPLITLDARLARIPSTITIEVF